MRTDLDILANFRLRTDSRGSIDSGPVRHGRNQPAHGTSESSSRRAGANYRPARGKVSWNDQAAGCRRFRLSRGLHARNEREILTPSGLERFYAGQLFLAVAFKGCAEPFGQFSDTHVNTVARRAAPLVPAAGQSQKTV